MVVKQQMERPGVMCKEILMEWRWGDKYFVLALDTLVFST